MATARKDVSGRRMRRRGAVAWVLAGAAGLLCGAAQGEKVYWKHKTGEWSWHEAANWGVGGVDGAAKVPTAADEVWLRNGTDAAYTIRLEADATLAFFNDATAPLKATFDLNGHALVARAGGGCLVNLAAANPETEARTPRVNELVFRNGTLTCTNGSYGFLLGNHGGKNSGGLVFDRVAYCGNVHFDCNSRLLVQNGSTWQLWTKNAEPRSLDIPYYQGMYMACGYVEISGTGSRFMGYGGARVDGRIRSDRHVLYVEDGGAAEFRDLSIGDASYPSTTSSVQVVDGTLDLSGNLNLGGTHADCAGNFLRIGGTLAHIAAGGSVRLHEQTGSSLRFDVPATGYRDGDGQPRAPLQAKTVLFVARPDGCPDNGPWTVRIRARPYFEARPDSATPLIRLAEPNRAALEALAAGAVFEDFIPAEYTAAAALAVNDEGTLLSLVAPPAASEPSPPEFTVSWTSPVGTTRTDFTLDVNTFGNHAAALTAVTCAFSVAGDWSDTVVSNWAGTVQGARPLTLGYAVDGMPEHRLVPARITLANDQGLSRTVETTFDAAGVVQRFIRKRTGVDDTWETRANWYEEKTVPDAPSSWVEAQNDLREEDTLAWQTRGDYTIRLARDHRIQNIAQAPGISTDDTSLYLFDLNGHTLDLTQVGGQSIFPTGACWDQADFAYHRSTVEFRNGTVNSPHAGFRLGNSGYPTGGGLVLSQGATLNANVTACVNGSRIIVKEGSVWNMAGGLTFQDSRDKNGQSGGYGFLCATGATSRVVCPGNLSLNTHHTGVYALDGGEVQAFTLALGHVATATNTFLDARNGTIRIDSVLQFGSGSVNVSPYPEIRVSGERGFVSASLVYYYPGTGGRFAFTAPEGGWRDAAGAVRAPIEFNELRTSARPVGYVDLGPVKLELAVRDWFRANPRASMPLIRLVSLANPQALADLKAQVVWKDVHPASFPAGFDPLAVSADGKSLVLTAPPASGLTVILR